MEELAPFQSCVWIWIDLATPRQEVEFDFQKDFNEM